MKKIIFLFLLFLFIPKAYAVENYNNYFNLIIPSNYSDILEYEYGANTKIIDIKNELDTYHNNYYNYAIFHYMTASYTLSYTYIYLMPLNSVPAVNAYANVGSSNTSFTLIYSTSGIRIGIQPSDSTTSVLDSAMFSSIKNCMENNVCDSSKPAETTYTGNIQYNINQGAFSNNRFKIVDFDSTVDYDVDDLSVLYYSPLHFNYLAFTGNSSQYVRKLKLMGSDIDFYDELPNYLDYISIPDIPDNPDNPDNPIDTNVGVWKDYIPWFVDNNSEYGVLVNIYIYIFILGIGFSIYLLIKLLEKGRRI